MCKSWGIFLNLANYLQKVMKGSILGPVLFSIFLNDIFNFITEIELYNYADDNTVLHLGPDLSVLVRSLENESAVLIDWFAYYKMNANTDTFLKGGTSNSIWIGKTFYVTLG